MLETPTDVSLFLHQENPGSARGRLVRVRRTPLGRGVFARCALAADRTIAELTGRIIDDPDYRSCYCIDLGGRFSLEPAPPYCYLNHACEPNCELQCVEADNEAGAAIELVAIRPIAVGDELTIDYAWPAEAAVPCRCGGVHCRGWIVAAWERHLIEEAATL